MKKETQHTDFTTKGAFGRVLTTPGKWWDKFNPGFGMRVSPKGRATWMYKGKSKGTGEHYEGSLAYAPDGDGVKTFTYQQALSAWREIKKYRNLSNEEKEAHEQAKLLESRQRITLEKAFDDFIENRVARGKQAPLSAATRTSYVKTYNRYLRNVQYGGRRIGEFVLVDTTARDWRDVIQAIAISNILRRTSPTLGNALVLSEAAQLPPGVAMIDAPAKQVMNLVSAIYDYLDSLEEVDTNPIRRVRKITVLRSPSPRKTRIPHVDMTGFYANLKRRTKVKQAADATKVKFFTGFRSSAVRRMRWDRIDFENGIYNVQRGDVGWKGFAGWVPLSDHVVDILLEIKSGARGYSHDEWVFPSRDRSTHLKSIRGTVEICGAGLSYCPVPHDLRKTFASACQMVLKDVTQVGALLAHRWATDKSGNAQTEQAVTLGYIVGETDVLRSAANRVVEVLLQISGEKPATEQTLSLLNENGLPSGHLMAQDIPNDEDTDDEEDDE